jgi:hypothetical protein
MPEKKKCPFCKSLRTERYWSSGKKLCDICVELNKKKYTKKTALSELEDKEDEQEEQESEEESEEEEEEQEEPKDEEPKEEYVKKSEVIDLIKQNEKKSSVNVEPKEIRQEPKKEIPVINYDEVINKTKEKFETDVKDTKSEIEKLRKEIEELKLKKQAIEKPKEEIIVVPENDPFKDAMGNFKKSLTDQAKAEKTDPAASELPLQRPVLKRQYGYVKESTSSLNNMLMISGGILGMFVLGKSMSTPVSYSAGVNNVQPQFNM